MQAESLKQPACFKSCKCTVNTYLRDKTTKKARGDVLGACPKCIYLSPPALEVTRIRDVHAT